MNRPKWTYCVHCLSSISYFPNETLEEKLFLKNLFSTIFTEAPLHKCSSYFSLFRPKGKWKYWSPMQVSIISINNIFLECQSARAYDSQFAWRNACLHIYWSAIATSVFHDKNYKAINQVTHRTPRKLWRWSHISQTARSFTVGGRWFREIQQCVANSGGVKTLDWH